MCILSRGDCLVKFTMEVGRQHGFPVDVTLSACRAEECVCCPAVLLARAHRCTAVPGWLACLCRVHLSSLVDSAS